MSNCEPHCQLCGVSFDIARLRRADEPESAGWCYAGYAYIGSDDALDPGCGKRSGCTVFNGDFLREREHLAGPGCTLEDGYSGHRISMAEMKGCRAIQCWVMKGEDWIPEDDDQDFELQGDCFLSGIGYRFTNWTPDVEDIKPVRHGVDSIDIENMHFSDTDVGIPFHPTCFEICKRICKMQNGKVDIGGLYRFFLKNCDIETFPEFFRRDYAVKSGGEQRWRHEPGSEYLVANPIEIPGLSQLLEVATHSASKTTFGGSEQPDESQMGSHSTQSSTPNSAKDPFASLSAEITSMILDHLGSKDIANLRLATRAYRQLPTILFRRLLLEDMPWLFEVQDLDVAKVNWYECYCTMMSGSRDLKGLRNRRRIWRVVEEILRRIEN